MSKSAQLKASFFIATFLIVAIQPLTHTAKAQIVYPSPWYTYSPITPRVGDVVIFNALEFEKDWNQSGQSILLPLTWYFGDGENATGTMVKHTYSKSGKYNVGVTAIDDRGYGGTNEKSITVREKTPVTINIALSSSFIKTGQTVTIKGNLLHNGSGVANEWITLSSTTYPFTQWNEIATVKTDEQGQYSSNWKAFYGYYHVKATWKGNTTYPESSTSLVLIVESYGDLINEYESNSTITGMNYNATYNTLRFTVEGPSGTKGYTKIYIREDWKFHPDNVTVLFDGNQIEYEISKLDKIWILELVYGHSIHYIEVNFNQQSSFNIPTEATPVELPSSSSKVTLELLSPYLIGLVSIPSLVLVGFLVFDKKLKRRL